MNLDKKLLSILIPELIEMEYPDLYPTKYLYVYKPEMELTLSYLFLMWPDFEIIDDIVCIISGENYRLFYQNELKRKIDKLRNESKSNKGIEKELNTIHFLTWFNNDISPITNERMDVFCTMILEIWEMKLKIDFPNIEFVFYLDKESWTFSFCQKGVKKADSNNQLSEIQKNIEITKGQKKYIENIFHSEIFNVVKDPGEYAIQQGSLSYGIAYIFFYWPNLIEYEGYILLEENFGFLISKEIYIDFKRYIFNKLKNRDKNYIYNGKRVEDKSTDDEILQKWNTYELMNLPLHSLRYLSLNDYDNYRFIFRTMEIIIRNKVNIDYPNLKLKLSIPCSDEDIERVALTLFQEKI